MSITRPMASPIRAMPQQDRRVLVAWFCAFLVLQGFVPPHLLDVVEHYTSPGGSFIEKIHPGAVLLYLVAGYALFTKGYPANRENRLIAAGSWGFLISIAVVVALGILTGQTQGASYLVDSLALGPVICLLMLRLSDADKRRVMTFMLYCLIVNDLVLFVEFALKYRFLPYPYIEPYFRPTAFLGHPLLDGLVNATAIAFLWLTDWKLANKVLLTLMFLTACFVAGARMASLIAIVGATASGWFGLGRLVRGGKIDDATRIVLAIGALAAVVFVVFLIVVFGFADRLIGYGFFKDESSQSRLQIYHLIDFMTPRQFMFGMPHDLADYIQTQTLKVPTDESPVASLIVEFGVVGLFVTAVGFVYYFWKMARAVANPFAWTGLIVFLAVSATNNQLASKGSHMTILAVFLMGALGASRAVRKSPQPRMSHALHPVLRPQAARSSLR